MVKLDVIREYGTVGTVRFTWLVTHFGRLATNDVQRTQGSGLIPPGENMTSFNIFIVPDIVPEINEVSDCYIFFTFLYTLLHIIFHNLLHIFFQILLRILFCIFFQIFFSIRLDCVLNILLNIMFYIYCFSILCCHILFSTCLIASENLLCYGLTTHLIL